MTLDFIVPYGIDCFLNFFFNTILTRVGSYWELSAPLQRLQFFECLDNWCLFPVKRYLENS